MHKDLIHNSEPFRDSEKLESKNSFKVEGTNSESKTIITGLDRSLFEKFKSNLKLNESPNSEEKLKDSSENIQNNDFLKKAYEQPLPTNDQTIFSEELDEKENVTVTLSKDAKKFGDDQNVFSKQENEDLRTKNSEISNRKIIDPNKKLGAGEEALEILAQKHHLMKQPENLPTNDLVEYEDDLFEEELIRIPGDEKTSKKGSKILDDTGKNEASKKDFTLEDEKNLENSFNKDTTYNEKLSEAEALLGLATRTCETGKIEEARASLKIYFDLLSDLGLEPSKDVQDLASKLDVSTHYSENKTNSEKVAKTQKDTQDGVEKILQDLPEETNYASVMDNLVKSLEKKEAYEEALPLLKDLLNYNRKRVNISEMDPLYDRIEQAYSSLKNDEKLVNTYKEHLSIKKQLNDLEGEINLLDLISYYYVNIGDQEASERYQEERKRIKDKLDKEIVSEG